MSAATSSPSSTVVEGELALEPGCRRCRDRGLDDAVRRADGRAELEIVEVVERVEDAEDVHPVHRDVAELVDGVVGVVGVTDGVGAAEEHLEGHVGHRSRISGAAPTGTRAGSAADVEGRAAPVLEGVAPGEGALRGATARCPWRASRGATGARRATSCPSEQPRARAPPWRRPRPPSPGPLEAGAGCRLPGESGDARRDAARGARTEWPLTTRSPSS